MKQSIGSAWCVPLSRFISGKAGSRAPPWRRRGTTSLSLLSAPVNGRCVLEIASPAALVAHGTMPLPPYIRRPADAADRERYQTVYAQDEVPLPRLRLSSFYARSSAALATDRHRALRHYAPCRARYLCGPCASRTSWSTRWMPNGSAFPKQRPWPSIMLRPKGEKLWR